MRGKFPVRVPSPAMAVSLAALFVALGGTSYAAFALPNNSVGPRQLKNGAVTTSKLKNGAVTASKLNVTGVTVPSALHADTATAAASATNAGHASNADSAAHATNADTATHAINADNATHAMNGVFAFGQVRDDGSIKDASSELASVTHTAGSGLYCLVFKDAPPFIALEGSVVSEAGTDPAPTLVPRVTTGQGTDCSTVQLAVRVQNTSGTLTDGRFSFIVP
jgi:hypothetical protein